MEKETKKQKIIDYIIQNGGYARMIEFKAQSIRTSEIKKLVDQGELEKIKAGLYRLSNIEYPSNVSIGFIDVSKAVPGAVICLISALSHYGLTQFNPSHVYVAIANKQSAVKVLDPPVEFFYFRDRLYNSGIETIVTAYGNVKIYCKEKSICDMFRYRNKLGEDIAIEALKNYISEPSADLYKIKKFAEICKIKNVLNPYLKALVG
ncbi:MAG: type IV toxin-antitoxin system AbiEi family antitoxin domain-containing protein [Candidatus Omnitrophota bacterium]